MVRSREEVRIRDLPALIKGLAGYHGAIGGGA
jgi:hypothetical protein